MRNSQPSLLAPASRHSSLVGSLHHLSLSYDALRIMASIEDHHHTAWPYKMAIGIFHETCSAADAMETSDFHPTVELHRPSVIRHHVGQAGSPNPTRTERPGFCTNALSPGIRPAAESALSWQFPLACPGMQGTRSHGHHLPATLSCHWRWSQCSGLPQTFIISTAISAPAPLSSVATCPLPAHRLPMHLLPCQVTVNVNLHDK